MVATSVPRYENLSQLGSWTVDKHLNSGGFGDVFLCERRDVKGDRKTAAIKLVDPRRPNASDAGRFLLKEYDMLKRVNSPYVAPIIDSGREKVSVGRNIVEIPWVAVEYVPGQSLSEEVKSQGVLNESEWLDLAHDLLSAVAATHQVGLVNSDIKPQNVMRSSRKSVLIDFGGATVHGVNEGDPSGVYSFGYSSPEQLSVKPDKTVSYESDIFSIGATLVFAATGVTPWDFPTIRKTPNKQNDQYAALVQAHEIVTTKKPRLDGLSPSQRDLVKKLIDIDPRMRLSASDALTEVRSLMAEGNPRKSGAMSFERIRSVAQFVRPKQDRRAPKSPSLGRPAQTPPDQIQKKSPRVVVINTPRARVGAEPGTPVVRRMFLTIVLSLFVPLLGALTRFNFLEQEKRTDYPSRIELGITAVLYSWWSFGVGGAIVARRWHRQLPQKALVVTGILAPLSMATSIGSLALAQINDGLGAALFLLSIVTFYVIPLIQNKFIPDPKRQLEESPKPEAPSNG